MMGQAAMAVTGRKAKRSARDLKADLILRLGGQRKSVERTLDAVRERLDREPGVSIIDTHTEIY